MRFHADGFRESAAIPMIDRPDLILINPGTWAEVYSQVGEQSGVAPPIGLGLIASFVRQRGFSVEIVDAEADGLTPVQVAEIVRRKNPLLAGVTAVTAKMTAATKIVSAIREKAGSTRTVIGGHHAAALPEETLRVSGADYVCTAEGFHPTVDLLRALRSGTPPDRVEARGTVARRGGTLFQGEAPPLIRDLDELPFVAWDLLPMGKYRAHNWHCFGQESRSPYAVVFSSLGCPFRCTYCSVNAVYGKGSYRVRSPRHFVEEIDVLAREYGVRHMEIVDDTFTVNKSRVHEICDLLIEREYRVNFWAYARTDTVDLPLLRKMKMAGIRWVAYGFESGNASVRNGVNKGQERIREAVGMAREAGIHIIANFIFGLPDDTLESMRDTLDLAIRINAEYANFWCAMAFPGSDLYRTAREMGWKLPATWHGYSQYSYDTEPLPTRHIAAKEVLRFRDSAFREYFQRPEYLATVRSAFGEKAASEVREMLERKLKRRLLGE